MAKKKDNKKDDKKAKSAKSGKPAPKKPAAKPVKKAEKSAAKKAAPKDKKSAKPAPKAAKPEKVKKATAKPVKSEGAKKPAGKPIDAIAKKGGGKKAVKTSAKKRGKGGDDEEDEDVEIEEEEEDDEDVEVKDDYEKPEDDEVPEAGLDEAGMIDLEGASTPDIDDDDDEVPEKRGRGRRKKNEGKSSGSSMEAYIRSRPLQIDINKPLIKKGNAAEPKPFVNTADNRSRYSDKELAEFKELILEKLKEAQADYDLLKQTLSNEDNHGTDDTSPSFKLLEDGSDVMSKEETAQLASRQEKYIVNLKNALVRIENKSYGICRVTGKLIPKERLRSVPHATLGIDAKLSQA
jgi:RNA polymerase-binding transcription factor DksA